MQSELSDDEDVARPQFPEFSAALPQAKSPHELDEEGAVNDVPHVTDDNEDSAGPQLSPVALPQAKSPHELDEEGVANDVPHVANDDNKDSARPQLPPVALPQAESPHKLGEESVADDVPHVANNNNEDSAEPQPPPVTLPQAKLPHKLGEEGAVDDVPHVADDSDEDSAKPQLPPVALPQAKSPHELDEEGVVNNVPQVEVNDEDRRGVFGSCGVSVFLRAIFISWSVGCRYMNKEFDRSEGLCFPQSNHIGIPASMKILAWWEYWQESLNSRPTRSQPTQSLDCCNSVIKSLLMLSEERWFNQAGFSLPNLGSRHNNRNVAQDIKMVKASRDFSTASTSCLCCW